MTLRLGPQRNSVSVYCMKLMNFNLRMEPGVENSTGSNSSSGFPPGVSGLIFFLDAIIKRSQLNKLRFKFSEMCLSILKCVKAFRGGINFKDGGDMSMNVR